MNGQDDDVIDFASYLKRKEEEASRERSTFSFWGGEGERSRFALPLWRAAYLGSGLRAALLSVGKDAVPGDQAPEALVVLDLREEPARVEFGAACLAGLPGINAPGTLSVRDEAIAVYLGELEDRRWYLVVDDLDAPAPEQTKRPRDDLLFLAGECAGLLFYKGLARSTGEEGER
jgi:hypothetical protein